ncbi:GNAT family N-acetyltransferase [Lentzea jiangxiensis]|uniref:GNAT family N-acetyltransferase n=1 Tax=Lentzea jiangxiensis TaxID=641025 RepID=UPI00115F90FF|nr:GNAT family N-acetyltransferase [Lentzea jiangxiensis]
MKYLNRDTASVAVEAVFEGMSSRSRFLRFHSPMPRLSASARKHLTDIDGDRHIAVAAYCGEAAVGIGRLIGIGGGAAEISAAVVDSFHRLGVGRELVRRLADDACRMRYAEIHASVLPENTPMIRLIQSELPGVRASRGADGTNFTWATTRGLLLKRTWDEAADKSCCGEMCA